MTLNDVWHFLYWDKIGTKNYISGSKKNNWIKLIRFRGEAGQKQQLLAKTIINRKQKQTNKQKTKMPLIKNS